MGFSILWLALALDLALALPKLSQDISQPSNESVVGSPNETYFLPMFDPGPLERSEELKRNQAGYIYGPSLIGNTSYFPTGTLGSELVAKDLAMWEQDAVYIQKAIAEDAPLAREALSNVSHVSYNERGLSLSWHRLEGSKTSRATSCCIKINGRTPILPESFQEA